MNKRRQNISELRLNLQQFTKFAKELNKALIETNYPPEVKISITDVRSSTCDIGIESNKFGVGKIICIYFLNNFNKIIIAHIIIFKSTSPSIPKSSDFGNLKTLKWRYKDVCQV